MRRLVRRASRSRRMPSRLPRIGRQAPSQPKVASPAAGTATPDEHGASDGPPAVAGRDATRGSPGCKAPWPDFPTPCQGISQTTDCHLQTHRYFWAAFLYDSNISFSDTNNRPPVLRIDVVEPVKASKLRHPVLDPGSIPLPWNQPIAPEDSTTSGWSVAAASMIWNGSRLRARMTKLLSLRPSVGADAASTNCRPRTGQDVRMRQGPAPAGIKGQSARRLRLLKTSRHRNIALGPSLECRKRRKWHHQTCTPHCRSASEPAVLKRPFASCERGR